MSELKAEADILCNLKKDTVKCLDKGFVKLIDVMPRLVPNDRKTADFAIVQSARVSYGKGTKAINEDEDLIRYLMRNQHTTPFEMIKFKFHCKMPIFVARQWIRHRTANVNEVSARYSIIENDFYYPSIENVRKQSKSNKQCGEGTIDIATAKDFLYNLREICETSYGFYNKLIDDGISREQARMLLPINIYTSWYWCMDLHNLLHFLSLRCHSHAQWETRQYAQGILELIEPIVPLTIKAWNDYHHMRKGMKLTSLEIQAIQQNETLIETDNKREQQEWEAKLDILNGTV